MAVYFLALQNSNALNVTLVLWPHYRFRSSIYRSLLILNIGDQAPIIGVYATDYVHIRDLALRPTP